MVMNPSAVNRSERLEWLLLIALIGGLVFQCVTREAKWEPDRVAGAGKFLPPPLDAELLPASKGKAMPTQTPASRARRVKGETIQLPRYMLKEAWENSLNPKSGGPHAYGLAPGATLPEYAAAGLGFTPEELKVFNQYVLDALATMQACEGKLLSWEVNGDGRFWRITSYRDEHDRIMADFRKKVLTALGPAAQPALDLMQVSPYLALGNEDVIISVTEGNDEPVVQIDTAAFHAAGPWHSSAAAFVTSRYSNVSDFAALENKASK
jgi:hypothetical protein